MNKPTDVELFRAAKALRKKYALAGKKVVVVKVKELNDLLNWAISGGSSTKKRRAA